MRALLVLACLVVGSTAFFDPCMHWDSCQPCVDDVDHRCGWCSKRVRYTKSGLEGGHCVSNNGSYPFTCDGVFSKVACEPGWMCDEQNHQCKLSPPGKGIPYFKCLEACGLPPSPEPPLPPTPPPAKVYACNHTTFKCYVTAPGTGKSKEFCEAECTPVPPTPATPTTPTAPLMTYLCNHTDFKCVPHPDGASKLNCEGACKRPPNAKFRCDKQAEKCVYDPNGVSYPQCEEGCQQLYTCNLVTEQCLKSTQPHHGIPLGACKEFCQNGNFTPEGLLGVWRGLQINTGFEIGEWDVEFKNDTIKMSGPQGVLEGDTDFFGSTAFRKINITVTLSTIKAYPVDSVFNAVFAYDTASPETVYLLLGAAPVGKMQTNNWKRAVSMSSGHVWYMVSCQPGTHCKFNYKTKATHMRELLQQAALSNHLTLPRNGEFPIRVAHEIPTEEKVLEAEVHEGIASPGYYDPCEHYDTCTECIADPTKKCGWCSGSVVYNRSIPGRHCAGGGYANITFTCHGGTYRTDSCNTYSCIEPQNVCKVTGTTGNTTLKECEDTCGRKPPAPVPAPFVPLPTYKCDESRYMCIEHEDGTNKVICEANCHPPVPNVPTPVAPVFRCNSTFLKCDPVPPGTPGATSLEICEGFCIPPPPPPILVGRWRGIQTDNEYFYGELDWVLKSDGTYSVSGNGKFLSSGRIIYRTAQGAILLIPTKGEGEGKAFAGIYTIERGDILTYVTFVFSNGPRPVPSGWDTPWILGGKNGHEYVLTSPRRSLFDL